MQQDAGQSCRDRARQKERRGERTVFKPRQQIARRAPDQPAGDHRGDQRDVDAARPFGQDAVKQPGHRAVDRQLERHGDRCGEHRRHAEERGAQQRGDKADRQPPRPAADEAAQQRRDMHRAEHGADLRNLPGQEGQNQRNRQIQRGIGEPEHARGHVFRMSTHNIPFKWRDKTRGRRSARPPRRQAGRRPARRRYRQTGRDTSPWPDRGRGRLKLRRVRHRLAQQQRAPFFAAAVSRSPSRASSSPSVSPFSAEAATNFTMKSGFLRCTQPPSTARSFSIRFPATS